ncbi:MAG TPA: hypothetical protein VH370_27660 [Humisphaera sp.]|jgi:hypothetical protein|nr:hypothetical protein [Humisphaera sp.]
MSYALLWIELLAISLLWIATISALAAHVKWKGDRILLVFGLVGLPWLIMWKWTTISQWLPFWTGREYLLNWRWYPWYMGTWIALMILLGVYCVVVGVFLLRTMRRPERGLARIVLMIVLALVPLVGLGALVNSIALIRVEERVPTPWFAYFLSLLIACVLGAVLLVFLAMRRREPGMGWAALLWPRGRLALATIVAVAVGLMTLWNMDLEMRSRAAMLRLEAGNLMLSASPPAVGGSDNAGPLYIAAFARLNREHWTMLEPTRDTRTASEAQAGKPPTDPRPQQWLGPFLYVKTDPSDPNIAALLARHEQTIKLLRQAAQRSVCRFDDERSAHDDNVWRVVGLIYLHARSEVSQGRVESGLSDVNILFHLRDHLAQASAARSSYLCSSDELAAVDILQEVLPHVTRSQELDALDTGDASAIRRILRRSYEAEEAANLALLSDYAAGQSASGLDRYLGSGAFDVFKREPQATLGRLFILPGDIELYREFMGRTQRDAIDPYYQVRGRIVELHTWSSEGRRKTFIASFLAPRIGSMFAFAARAEAAHAVATAAIAATRYKLAHGRAPEKLTDLLSDELDETPKDPFDGQPLRMTVVDGKWTVYSIGPDGVDDGGKIRAGWKSAAHRDGDKGDILFTLDSTKTPG